MVIVSKRTQRYGDEEKVFWKNRWRKLTPGGLGQESPTTESQEGTPVTVHSVRFAGLS